MEATKWQWEIHQQQAGGYVIFLTIGADRFQAPGGPMTIEDAQRTTQALRSWLVPVAS